MAEVWAAEPVPLDSNTASAEQLKALPGLGAASAKAILNGRPSKRKGDLISTTIIPHAMDDQLEDGLLAKPRETVGGGSSRTPVVAACAPAGQAPARKRSTSA